MDVLRAFISAILIMVGLIVVVQSRIDSEKKRLLLDNEPNVDLGGKLNQLKAQLLEQQKLIHTIQNDLQLQANDLQLQAKDLELQKNTTNILKQENEHLKASQKAIQNDLQLQAKDLELQKNITDTLKQENEHLKASQTESGSVYVRWGRNVCPSNATVIYTGFSAGKHYDSAGSGSDNLCLPRDPTWSRYMDGTQSLRSAIYGTEIDTNDEAHIFSYPVNEQDVPCVVCRTTKASTVMIPARTNCYPGWTVEYSGYLMAGYQHANAYNHVCMDGAPEFLNHGGRDDNQHILYLVESHCGSLPCPPYVEGHELACVVCSK